MPAGIVGANAEDVESVSGPGDTRYLMGHDSVFLGSDDQLAH